MSEDDDDVVVLRVCGNRSCMGVEDLVFDEDTNEMYCGRCRALFQRAEVEGFRVMLTHEDLDVVRLIFNAFEGGGSGEHFGDRSRGAAEPGASAPKQRTEWTYEDFIRFREAIGQGVGGAVSCSDDLCAYFKEEFDLDLAKSASRNEYVVTLADLENMYGGFLYNGIDAIREDCEALEEGGAISTAILE